MSKNAETSRKGRIISRVDRIVQLLRQKPRTAQELTEILTEEYGFNVSRRTVERDLNDATGSHSIRHYGKAGHREPQKWTAGNGKKGPAPEFTDEVALAALIAEKHLTGIKHQLLLNKLKPFFEYAQSMLEHNTHNRSLAANWHRFVDYVPSDHQLQAPEIPVRLFEQLLRDVFEQNVIEIDYVKHRGDPAKTFKVTALGIVYRGKVPYLVCRFLQKNDAFGNNGVVANLPISRIQNLKGVITESPQVGDFKLKAHAERHFDMTIGEEFTLELQIFDSVRREIQDSHLGKNQVIRPVEGHSTIFWLQVDVPYNQNLVNWLNARCAYLKVLSPQPFREMFYRDIKRAAAMDGADVLSVPPPNEKTFVPFAEIKD
ncbi:helix-turn-helix transcriptional regulator [Pseudidiomarina terrestris]|uniref:helix-turn-helix transcriptional regulator n=1 Tax=Pseudidiomarina terrestris TaxID=2820060 RepID=UPI00264FB4C4|nr:WYL domain-containing protein [Pseudidiomarina sp. 1ASP75-5]MDN7135351.1 WYL domain-containing transcriptional regulator [Pseudidiomarina sp. 1ASP75-5]